MDIDIKIIQKLRQETGAGMLDCQKALQESKGDLEEAKRILRKKGKKIANQKENRETRAGLIEAYIHAGGKVGAMIELTCETDFVARNEEFKNLAHDLAMQVAATNPLYLTPEDIPEEVLEKEKEIIKDQLPDDKKKPEIIDKIIQGKLDKYFSEVCLLKQPFIKDDKLTIEDLIANKIAKIGENIKIKRFVRFSLS